MSNYIVSPFRQPKTPILPVPQVGTPFRCQCGNEDQNRFLTVTSLGGTELHGAVCAPCEANAIDRQS
jgi:hypothetical protein